MELENPEKKKKENQPSSAQLGRTPASPDRRAPPVSGGFSPACALSRSLPTGADLSVTVALPARPLFSLCAVDSPCQFCPPRARRGPARAHVAGFLGHDARPRTQLPS
jgi:hypothetical protein